MPNQPISTVEEAYAANEAAGFFWGSGGLITC
jgi:hypothetical protein